MQRCISFFHDMRRYAVVFGRLDGGMLVREKGIRGIWRWILIFTAVPVVVLLVLTALQAGPENLPEKNSGLHKWDTGWYYNAEDGTKQICQVPSRIKISGGEFILQQTVPDFLEEEKYLGFLNHYQQVEVFIDGESRYRYTEEQTGLFRSMMGNTLCMIKLNKEDCGKDIAIRLGRYNKSLHWQIPVIYLDSRESLLLHIWMQEQPKMIFCLVLLVLSAGLFLLWLLLRVREEVRVSSVFHAWVFILVSALWILTDSRIMIFFVSWPRFICLISFYAFYMFPIPMLSFISEVCGRKSVMLDWMKTILVCNVLVQSLLYLTGICKLMNMLPVTHVLYGAAIVCLVLYMAKELRSSKAQYAKIFFIGVFFLMFMAAVSLLSFYTGVGSRYAMYYQLGLLGFMCALICMTIRQVNEILEDRTGDRILEELAYMDVMTKLGNRSAYEMRLQKLQETMSLGQELSAVMADLNGLKKVNDTLGHKAGDEMIKGCAKCLQEAFCGFGEIYRIGGDEFLILLRHLQSIRTWEENLKEAQEKYNSEHEVKISIAAGLATGRKAGESDKWLHELIEQADKNMYENKKCSRE